jgi:hypothetical protein
MANVKIPHFGRDLDRQAADIKAADGRGRAEAAPDVRPKRIQILATGRNDPHSGNDHSTFGGACVHGGRPSRGIGLAWVFIRARRHMLSMSKIEAVLSSPDLITIFAWNTLHRRLIRQMATSVIRFVLLYYLFGYNNK